MNYVQDVLGRIVARLLENGTVDEVSVKKDFSSFRCYVVTAYFNSGNNFVNMKISATDIESSPVEAEIYAVHQVENMMNFILKGCIHEGGL